MPDQLTSDCTQDAAPRHWLQRFVKKPRHKWFSAPNRCECEGWFGPHDTIETAIIECASNYGREYPIYVAQGYRITKAERDVWGVEFDWQVESQNAIEVRLPENQREMATGVITYTEDGNEHTWSIGCMAWETPEHLSKHLSKWKPRAKFVSGEIIPDKRSVQASYQYERSSHR